MATALGEQEPMEEERSDVSEEAKAAATDPVEKAMKLKKGKLVLEKPIRAKSQDVTELSYDFTKLTGWDFAQALDSDSEAGSIFHLTNKQAFALFAAAAARATGEVDETDVKTQMGVADAVCAMRIASLFFAATVQAGNRRILNG